MAMKSLENLFLDELKDLYDAERQITKALPKMAKVASSDELANAFREHLEQTQGHIERLERVFEELGEKPGRKKCEAMKGLIEEGEEIIKMSAEDPVRDAGLIGAAQKVEHYEMAGYGTLRTWAQQLGHDEVADLLQQTLDEEEETDKLLTGIAGELNLEAAQLGEAEEEE
jgi:ferritin-like metal-binding protein YciE